MREIRRNTPARDLPSVVDLLADEGVEFLATDPVSGSYNERFMYFNCPHCPDENFSAKLNRDRNVYHCRACGTGGSVLNYIRYTRSLSVKEAVEWLTEREISKNKIKGEES